MPKIDFKALKDRVSLHDVLDHYGILEKLTRKGQSLRGKCPLHEGDNETSFSVSFEKNAWHCFGGCGGGNQLDFVSKKENLSVFEAAKKIVEWFSIDDLKETTGSKIKTEVKPEPKESAGKGSEQSADPDPVTENKPLGFSLKLDPNHPYLKERGLTEETIEAFGVGYCDKGVMKGRIAIPIHNRKGEIVGYAGRWPGQSGWPDKESKYKFPKGFSKGREVFNIHQAAKEDEEQPLIIVEGFFDCMWLWQIGFKKVVAVMGSELLDWQKVVIGCDTKIQQILLAFDDDEAGREGRDKASSLLANWFWVRSFVYPQGKHQPTELTKEEVNSFFGKIQN